MVSVLYQMKNFPRNTVLLLLIVGKLNKSAPTSSLKHIRLLNKGEEILNMLSDTLT